MILGQKQKLLEDTLNVMQWMSNEVFDEFVQTMIADRPELLTRLQRNIDRVQRRKQRVKLLTENK
jgi:hemoglobin-like flavoprotein